MSINKRKNEETFDEERDEGLHAQQKESSSAERYERYPGREDVLAAARCDGTILYSAPKEIRSDPEVVLAAVQQNAKALSFAAKELRENRDFCWQAIRTNCWALPYAPQEIRGDRQVVMEVVGWNGLVLEFASPEWRADRDIVLAAIRSDGRALQFASLELRGDRQVVFESVNNVGSFLRYASLELRGDREIVLVAIRSDARALQFASHQLRLDREFVTVAVRNNARALRYASEELREHSSIVGLALGCLELGSLISNLIGPKLRLKLRWVLEAIQQETPRRGDQQERELLSDAEAIQQLANQLRQRAFEKVCLLWKICHEHGVALEHCRTILDFWNAKPEFWIARHLEYCSPVLQALGEKGCSFHEAETMLDRDYLVFY